MKEQKGISRRGFVKGAVLSAAAAAGASVLSGCGATQASELPKKWDKEADIVVVGFGGAGAAAAIEAGKAGAEVVVLERMPVGGGSTAICGGIIYMGGGTPIQKAAGFDDSLDALQAYLLASAGAGADPDMVQTYVDKNLDLFDWLVEIGVKFKESYLPGKWAAPPTDDGLVYSGNETQATYAAVTPPVPRGHHVQAPGSSGAVLWPPLQAAAEAAGAEILTEALAERLVATPEGRVAGVVAQIEGEEQYIKAKKAVILTAGGFFANKEMMAQHCPEFLASQYQVGTDGDDGSGIRMGQGAGGDLRMMSGAFAYSAAYMYSEALVKGVLVNQKGRRFIGEDNYGSFIGCALVKGNQTAFLIVDDAVWSEVPDAAKEAITLAGQADTIAELVTNLGLNPVMVESTVSVYNQFAAEGQDPEFQKDSHYVVPLETGPFYALPYLAAYAGGFTTGGLRINTKSEVLDVNGEPVPGLYSAGRNAFAVTAQNYPGSGTSVGEALIFGRIAGEGAAALEDWS
jgi:3-oxo-5alpha-steroid 4-dehydrogenase